MTRDERETPAPAGLRVDKWLWCARFFKSRAQATDAVAGGLVHVNGERVKPARLVHVDDRLQITRDELQFEVIVQRHPGAHAVRRPKRELTIWKRAKHRGA